MNILDWIGSQCCHTRVCLYVCGMWLDRESQALGIDVAGQVVLDLEVVRVRQPPPPPPPRETNDKQQSDGG